MNAVIQELPQATAAADARVIPLSTFVSDFGEGLLEAVSRQNPPI